MKTPNSLLRTCRLSRPLLALSLCCGLFFATACSGKNDSDTSKQETVEFTAEQQKEREAKALALAQRASTAPRPAKIKYLTSLVAYYPESKYAPQAHSELILYLMHAEVNEPDKAWKATVTFAERHPNDARASEAFSWMHKYWRDKDPKRAASVLKEWASFLDAALDADDFEGMDHKATFAFSRSEVAFESGEAKRCEALLKEVSTWDLKQNNRMLLTVFRLGSLNAARGDDSEAKTYFERALELIAIGARGPTAEIVQAEIDKLKS